MAQDQRVEFLFAAQVTGQNELQRLTQAVDKLRQETDQLRGANAGLAASTDAVIRNGVRYNNALDAQSKELRNARQGTQQLGMQINDFATSVSTGASITQAFNQQLGQVGFAMSQMGGKAGAVGAFLAGPWGAAITIGVMALTPLIDKLVEVVFGAQKAESALDGMLQKQRQLARERMAPSEAAMEINKIRGEIDKLEKFTGRKSRGIFDIDLPAQKKKLQELKWKLAEYEGMQAASSFVAPQQRATSPSGGASSRLGGGGGFAATKIDPQAELQKRLQEAQLKDQANNLSAFQRLMDSILGKTLPEYETKMREAYAAQAALTGPEQAANAQVFSQALDAIDAKRIAEEFKELNANLSGGLLPEIADQTGKFNSDVIAAIDATYELRSSFESIGKSVSDAFQGMLTGATSFKDGMKGVISSVISELWRLYVVQQIVGFFTGTVMPGVQSVFKGKALGGSVGKNQPYMVGERGPELFIPGGSGTIIPNRNLGGGGGGGNAFNISVDARGSADPAAVRAQVQQGILEAAPAIIAAAEARTVNGLRRPRLGGVMQ